MVEAEMSKKAGPEVALWRTWALRLIFLAMFIILGNQQWTYILTEDTEGWHRWRGVGHAMLAALSLLALLGVFHPLKALPLMIFEMVWKAIWLTIIALPAWQDGREIPDIVDATASSIGIALLLIVIPWPYVWWRYVTEPIEPWRRNRT